MMGKALINKKHKLIVVLLFALFLPFNNCSDSGFNAKSTGLNSQSNQSAGVDCTYPVGAGIASPNGLAIGSVVTGFSSSAPIFPMTCGSPSNLTCNKVSSTVSQWSGSTPLYQACVQKCAYPDNGQPMNINDHFVYYSRGTGTSAECAAARVDLTCLSSGQLSATPSQQRFATCAEQNLPQITSISATPSTISLGQQGGSKISWAIGANAGALTLTLDPGGMVVTNTTQATVNPTQTTTYTLTAKNQFGSVSANTTVTVNSAPPIINSFVATPTTIYAGTNKPSRLTWSVSSSAMPLTLKLDPGNIDVSNVSAMAIDVTPTQTTEYVLTATNPSGSVTARTTVTVSALPDWVVPTISLPNVVGSTFDLKGTLPGVYIKGGAFALGGGSTPLPTGVTLSTDGILTIVDAAIQVKDTSGIVFSYTEP